MIISRLDSNRKSKQILELNLEKIKYDKIELEIFDEEFKNKKESIIVDISQNNLQKIIKFSEKSNRVLENTQQKYQSNIQFHKGMIIEFSLDKLGVSLMNNSPQEILYLTLQGLSAQVLLDEE